jgi:hypothetical protein
MKILYLDTFIHKKNKIGFILMCKSHNIECIISKESHNFDKEWDLVFIPSDFVNPSMFPNARNIMYGPHNFTLVNGIWKKGQFIFPPNCFYNLLSDWIIDVQNEVGGLCIPTKPIPFAVDVDNFSPIVPNVKNYDCFIYYKGRNRRCLEMLINEVRAKNLSYNVIQYGSYDEETYKKLIRESKFGIWVGSHESQGFALEECLSCDTPLLIYNVTSMFDEHDSSNKICYTNEVGKYKLIATSSPYWDERCGLQFTEENNISLYIDRMVLEYSTFKPRDFILETLSPKVCMDRLVKNLR